MSTHSRLACALAALALPLAVPAATPADTGGAVYGVRASSHAVRSTPTRSRHRLHLGDRVPVRRGMRGHDVRVLQDFFNRIGMPVSIDGTFGHGTWAALRRFEKRARLRVDGVLGARDIAALRRVIGAGGWAPHLSRYPAQLPSGSRATVNPDGTAAVGADAPGVVRAIIAAGNAIAKKPYHYGGGHGRWNDSGYDCSGSVSYALHGGGLLQASRDSTGFERFGLPGAGRWVTIYANSGHAYMVVAGLRFDTSGRSGTGSRWQASRRPADGYVVRHPAGL